MSEQHKVAPKILNDLRSDLNNLTQMQQELEFGLQPHPGSVPLPALLRTYRYHLQMMLSRCELLSDAYYHDERNK